MNRFLQTSENIAAFFLLLIALLVSVNFTLRDIFAIQIPDWFDFSRQLQAIALFWGIAIATYRAGHICVDAVWEQLGRSGKRILDLIASGVTLLFLIPMAWMIWVKVSSTGTQATSDLRLPLVYFYILSALGASAAVLLAAWRVWDIWQGRNGPADAEPPHGS